MKQNQIKNMSENVALEHFFCYILNTVCVFVWQY